MNMNENEQETRGSTSLEREGVGSTQDRLCEETLPPQNRKAERTGRSCTSVYRLGLGSQGVPRGWLSISQRRKKKGHLLKVR